MKRYLVLTALLSLLSVSTNYAVQINEIRADEPGGTDSNEFIELKGAPGESLNGLWYLAIGDHSSFDNPRGENIPEKGSGVVEFAISLDGLTIPDDGFFLIAQSSLQIDLLGLTAQDVDLLVVPQINFENFDNITHLLVRNYTGNDNVSDFNDEVYELADQYDDAAVDIDDDDDGVPNATLPWTEIIDGIGLVYIPNDQNPQEYTYAEALGWPEIGPSGSFPPGMVYRGSNDGEWNIGNFNLINEAGDGLFLGDDFRGPALDTPGTENPATLTVPRVFAISPGSASEGETVSIQGDNLLNATSVTLGGQEIAFTVVDDNTIQITITDTMETGLIVVTTPDGQANFEFPLEVLVFNRQILLFEDFEEGLGQFVTVSLSSDRDWFHDSFSGDFFAEMNGFGGNAPSDDWLITPEVDLSGTTEPVLNFVSTRNFGGPALVVKIATDFDGLNPSTATWTTLEATLSTGNYEDTPSGDIDLSAYIGESVHVAFHYTSEGGDAGQGALYQIDDVLFADNVLVTSDIFLEDFETDLGSFTAVSVASNAGWAHDTFDSQGFAEMNGFGADVASDDWLISPAIDLSTATFPLMEFVTAKNFGGPDLEVLISANYNGSDPAAADWESIDAPLSSGNYEQVNSGFIGLTPYIGATVHVAFRYTSAGTGPGEAAQWEVHQLRITEGAADSFAGAWINDLQWADFYYYGDGWGYKPTMGLIQLSNFPWVHQQKLGYMLVFGISLEDGAWIYVNDKWGWFSDAYGGFIFYTDGTFENLLAPQES